MATQSAGVGFRTVHLAELVAQLVTEGRQIVCAVEDSALADLFYRRLPIERLADGKRIFLGFDADGAICKSQEGLLAPVVRNSWVGATQRLAAGGWRGD